MLFWIIWAPIIAVCAIMSLTFVMNLLELELVDFLFFVMVLTFCWLVALAPFLIQPPVQ